MSKDLEIKQLKELKEDDELTIRLLKNNLGRVGDEIKHMRRVVSRLEHVAGLLWAISSVTLFGIFWFNEETDECIG